MAERKLSASIWVAIAGVAVPVVLAMVTMFGRNTALLTEHGVRITNVEDSQRLLVDETLKGSESRKRIRERISRIEGQLSVTPETPIVQIQTDGRGHR